MRQAGSRTEGRMGILVTGAAGNVGREVVRLLRAAGHDAVAADLDETRVRDALGPGVPFRLLDFTRPCTFAAALRGMRAVFLLRPPAIASVKRHVAPFIDAARDAGVAGITFISVQGVERNRMVPHWRIEQAIRRSGIPFTFIRPGFYMQNLSTTHRRDIAERGELLVPAGPGKAAYVDARDVAAAAVVTLTADGHAGQAYEVTGPEALDSWQVADTLSRVLGRPVRYDAPSPLAFWRRMRSYGHPRGFVAVMVALYTVIRLGKGGDVTSELPRLLGRPPADLESFVRENAAAWR